MTDETAQRQVCPVCDDKPMDDEQACSVCLGRGYLTWTVYQHARRGMRCPKCGAFPTSERHYPDGYGDCDKPVDRHYCAPCDVEWWIAWPDTTDAEPCGNTVTWAGYVNVCDLEAGHDGPHSMQQPGTSPVRWATAND